MHFVVLRLAIASICMAIGFCCLYLCVFRRRWFVEGGLLHKKYYGDDGRIFYAMIGVFFVLGGLAFLLSK